MPVDINNASALITTPHLTEGGNPASNPPVGQRILFAKSGGFYEIDSAGTVVGPFASNADTGIYALLAGRSGGQVLDGGLTGDDLTLRSNALDDGNIYFGAAGALGTLFSAGQLVLPAAGSTGGLLIGGDTALYRSAANTLFSPDTLRIESPTATREGLIIKTTDDTTTKNLIEARASNDDVTLRFFHDDFTGGRSFLYLQSDFQSRFRLSGGGKTYQLLATGTNIYLSDDSEVSFFNFAEGTQTNGGILQSSFTGAGGADVQINFRGDIVAFDQGVTWGARYVDVVADTELCTMNAFEVTGGGEVSAVKFFRGTAKTEGYFTFNTGGVERLKMTETGGLELNGFTMSTVGLTVKGAASQTANLQEWQNSSGGVVHSTGDGLAASEWVHNEGGIDIDFRVESLTYDALFVDASNESIDIMHHASGKIGFFAAAPAVQAAAYTPTNVVTDRSYDANATTTAELADVLGTLIADLQSYGLVQ